ncbi:hypothetical protein FEE95_07945 [Maribacter algarum]|uniref:Uncharacterized protein n=1 Tax=Maribacter algarum (ex Zhang et al. 2020) TaxID=2578118 RepID=A0A5S3QN75_9FLAO|nr:hypothetical protein [Maribacter algarum]TMM59354.1 hypothetical protein FEE95_07945 [Maribacter algarum]
MATGKLVVIKDFDLSNNCPECFNQDLKLTFYQKHVYGKLFHRTTNQVTNQIICNKCGSDIYPAKWTDDIERIFNYYQKMAVPEKSSLKFTTLFYVLILVIIALAGAASYLFYEGILTI